MKLVPAVAMLATVVLVPSLSGVDAVGRQKVRISWGHEARQTSPYYIKLMPAIAAVEVQDVGGHELEPGEGLEDGAWRSSAGVGDVDGVDFTLVYPVEPARKLQNLHIIWADLIAKSDAETARRLSLDPAFRTNTRKLTVLMDEQGTRGFSVSVDQILEQKTMWIPSLHVYLAAGDEPLPFRDHLNQLAPWQGRRILDQVRQEPEATYQQYASRWEDMGNPAYTNPQQRGPGHIVGLTWDSAVAKFGIDRGAGVWNDYGNPDRFRFWFGLGDLAEGITSAWNSQSLNDGLPVITTVFEKDGVRYEVEQFAYPLNGPPPERRGDIPMVLLQRVKATHLQGTARRVPITMSHRRQFPPHQSLTVVSEKHRNAVLFLDSAHRRTLLTLQGVRGDIEWAGTRDYQRDQKRINITVFEDLPAGGSRELVVKLPSPALGPEGLEKLVALDYESARTATLNYWSRYLERGAQFRVPEKAVNDLFGAGLWHGLRLPRRHGGEQEGVQIDLPYSNFAYSQTGTPWPVNQAVYVDYMLYDLRGYHDVSAEELLVQYRNNQEFNGHVNGVANWLVYTPGMLYAVANHFLLSQDRQALDKLLPYSLKALDWCLAELERASKREGPSRGLVLGPLNDGTGEGIWAFNQAYMFGGLDLFGRVLKRIGHARAQEALDAAQAVRQAAIRGFGAASARSPLVQLRDRTWIPYVPCEALTYGRILDQWYPTDVDTGAVHLLRLKSLPPDGELADSLLNDHEDNLYLHGWGIANEPVYNQQGTAYLLRDDAKAAIRTFYSYMASAFSHSVFEPVEHRWTHGQYFGPPSTDGAWFELYRNMLVRELDDATLLLGQATPRKWLEDGKQIIVEDAPTWFGKVSLKIDSRAGSGKILATIQRAGTEPLASILVRLRHPEGKLIQSVAVNGQDWKDFDVRNEWVRIEDPGELRYSVVASY